MVVLIAVFLMIIIVTYLKNFTCIFAFNENGIYIWSQYLFLRSLRLV